MPSSSTTSLLTLTLFLTLSPTTAYFFRRLSSFLARDPSNKSIDKSDPPQLSPVPSPTTASNSIQITPIGHISSIYPLCVGTPRQGSLSPSSRASLTLSPDSACISGLSSFTHVWILFHFHLNTSGRRVRSKISPPSLGGKKVGVLSTRSPHRYNDIGFSLVRLESIQIKKNVATLKLTGVDLCDGTPVIDVKPYVPHYDSVGYGSDEVAEVPGWINEGLKLRRKVVFKEGCKDKVTMKRLKFYDETSDFFEAVEEILSVDVRSKYHTKKARSGKSSQPAVSSTGSRVDLEEVEGVCRQQIDSVMVYFKCERNVGKEWGEGSGAEDFIEVIDMVHV
ncbi:hypothetical protein TrVE_jg14261 [Triparma verrucosa]|uniref:TsaA-like domain-containing protein n=1 Tax=Triparma verrucosa TaxID=1606542 RepID=A0A9W7C1E2_9STRA|nr:hypothetical protein TrVE_jg14261 [Triparma verrucosa]